MLDKLPLVDENEIYLSVKEKRGMDELLDMIIANIFSDYKKCKMLIPFEHGSVVSYLNEHANVISTDYEEKGTILIVECNEAQYNKYKNYIVEEL